MRIFFLLKPSTNVLSFLWQWWIPLQTLKQFFSSWKAPMPLEPQCCIAANSGQEFFPQAPNVSKTPVLHCGKLWTRIFPSSTQCHSPSVVPLQIYLKQVVFPHWAAACCLKQGSASVCPLHNQTLKLGCNEGAASSWIILHENNNYWKFLANCFHFFYCWFLNWSQDQHPPYPPPILLANFKS